MTNPVGTWFESRIVEYLRWAMRKPEIDRLPRKGKNDEGDVGGVRALGYPVVVEAKHVKKLNLAGWLAEAEAERLNKGAIAAIVVHKRVGKGARQMGDQYVTMTLADYVAITTGRRPGNDDGNG